ncbi:MAG: tRNA (adenosine(37)-N6)-threonylcarbamoyltransferase complex ATPase subunit type 1 TsaE [Ignavibacteriaceae bacterium]|nr:tRNA (adenosine(37)-N6)-threonylcarbamoyltransferase complex ATPase subunit type 1 TsaE [Ignavibacteriaceae bacterium]
MTSSLLAEKKSHSEGDTAKIAEEFNSYFRQGDVVSVNGNLGAGKTFFVKCIGHLHGIDDIKSPTFTLVNIHTGDTVIQHLDFYRINYEKELTDIGINEIMAADYAITFIEWGVLFPAVLPEQYYIIEIEHSNETRIFRLYKHEK